MLFRMPGPSLTCAVLKKDKGIDRKGRRDQGVEDRGIAGPQHVGALPWKERWEGW